MWRAVITESIELRTNSTFVRNLFLSTILSIFGVYGLAELQNQTFVATQQTSIANISSSSSTKIAIDSD